MDIRHVGTRCGLLLAVLLAACGDDGAKGRDGTSCSVSQDENGRVTLSCDDGTQTTLDPPTAADGGPGGACSVERNGPLVTILCPDGSSVTIDGSVPDAGAGNDGGPGTCTVTQASNGSIDIRCPDGSQATIPGDATVSTSVKIGAATASCGTCHDSAQAKAHFRVMTVDLDGGPIETCGTCHNESSLEPVSKAHALLPFGPPGLKIEILSAAIDAQTRKPTVRLQMTDAVGTPLVRTGMSISLTLAKIPPITNATGNAQIAGPYQSYLNRTVVQRDSAAIPIGTGTPRSAVQPTAENSNTGTFVQVAPGVYDYTFAYTLPVGYDAAASHVVGLYGTRTVDGVRFVSNDEHFFVPNNASATPLVRDVVKTETCNNCHNPLAFHGGSRQNVQVCLTCHSQGAIDPESENSIDFNIMVHRIHRGKNLPSVVSGTPYLFVGNSQNTYDYSHVGYPQPIENCQSCHTATDSDRWITNGTRAACTSCHDDIDKAPAEGGHPFQLLADATCGTSSCHSVPGNVADAFEAHKTFLNLDSAPVFDVSILSVSVLSADNVPEVRIRARTGTRATGATLPVTSASNLSTLNVFINGPNTGFTLSANTIVQVPKAELVNLAPDGAQPGEFTFALPRSLRALVGTLGDPEVDSYTLSLRAAYDPTPTALPDNDRVDMLKNPVAAFTAGEDLVTRPAVVQTEKCNDCHGDLRAHGGGTLARNVEQCAMCHTGTLDTRVRQGANKEAGPTTSLRFSTMVHRIHGNGIASTPYKAYGFSPMAPYPVIDFSAVPFPGNARDCTSCHAAGTYFLPLPEGDPPTETVVLDADGQIVGP